MTDPKKTLRYPEVMAEEGLDDWRFFLVGLHARFRTGSFVKGLELVTRITEAAEAANHHPDVVLTYPQVDVDLQSHDVGGVTSRDLDLARPISAIAAELGVEPTPREVSRLELALDVPDADEVKPFWAAALGYDMSDRWPDVFDPGGRNNTVWFQKAPGATGEVQQRFHLDIVVPREVAEERVQAAIDAGGTLVSTDEVPAFWVLADQHGNKVCICTADGREPTSPDLTLHHQHELAEQVGEPPLVGGGEGAEQGGLVAALEAGVPVEGPAAGRGEPDVHPPPVLLVHGPGDQAIVLERTEPRGQGAPAQAEVVGEVRRTGGVRRPEPAQRQQDLERRPGERDVPERGVAAAGQVPAEDHQPGDDRLVHRVEVVQLVPPARDVPVDGVLPRCSHVVPEIVF